MKKGTGAHLHKSPNYHQKIQKRYSARKEKTRKLLTDGYRHSFVSNQESLQITLIQGQLLEKENHLSSNKCYPSRLSKRDHGRKQKIYETDEFIDYLLNYYNYQTPKYASVCLEPSHTTSTRQWQRSIHAKEMDFKSIWESVSVTQPGWVKCKTWKAENKFKKMITGERFLLSVLCINHKKEEKGLVPNNVRRNLNIIVRTQPMKLVISWLQLMERAICWKRPMLTRSKIPNPEVKAKFPHPTGQQAYIWSWQIS